MRRALNILQACHAANDVIDEDSVYNCTGNPHPRDIEAAFQAMMQQEFTTAYHSMYTSMHPHLTPQPYSRTRSPRALRLRISSRGCTR